MHSVTVVERVGVALGELFGEKIPDDLPAEAVTGHTPMWKYDCEGLFALKRTLVFDGLKGGRYGQDFIRSLHYSTSPEYLFPPPIGTRGLCRLVLRVQWTNVVEGVPGDSEHHHVPVG